MESQANYVLDKIQNHPNSSPTSLIERVNYIVKGAQLMAHGASIMGIELAKTQEANKKLTARNQQAKKAIRGAVTRTVSDGLQLASQVNIPATGSRIGVNKGGPARQIRRCGRCREPGHPIETCKQLPSDSPVN
jgi:hypothetical protein